MSILKKPLLWAFVLSSLAGTAMHFAYDLLPIPLVGLLAPISESVWEHLKLLYWPFLVAAAILARKKEDPLRWWSAALTAALLQPLVMTGTYYLLNSGFGVECLWVDIGLYYAVMAFGFLTARRLERTGRMLPYVGLLIVLAAIYGVSLMAFSLAAPSLPIFTAP